jgi:leucine dehydrogenase
MTHVVKLPALGGCRFVNYENIDQAFEEAKLLTIKSKLKSALLGLNYAAAQAIIIKPYGHFNRTRLFAEFGKFVNELKGRFIAMADVGTTIIDLEIISKQTPYVAVHALDLSIK